MAGSEDRLLDCEQSLLCSKIRAERSANSERERARFETARSLTLCERKFLLSFLLAYRVSVNNSRYIRDFVKNGRKTMLYL